MNRRHFFKFGCTAVCGLALTPEILLAKQKPLGKTLILIEFKGGNDGLNTLIPFSDKAYYDLRPNIAIKRDSVIQLNEKLGFHPSLKPLIKLWDNKDCAMVMGVGYPDQNRSHFRSIEIWDSASDSQEVLQNGWLNEVLAKNSASSERVVDGVVLGQNAGALQGENLRVIHMQQKIKRFNSNNQKQKNISPALQHVLDVQQLLDQSHKHFKKSLKPLAVKNYFPNHRFGNELKLAAQIIASQSNVPVIKISLGSFDTHGGQLNTHKNLLKQFAEGIAGFEKTMKQLGFWDDVLIMSYSEFGRRASENGSKGTDHGTAAPHFVMGGKVKGGLYGKQPSLHDLENRDLKHHVDFRQIYSSLEQDWFGMTGKNSAEFKKIPFL